MYIPMNYEKLNNLNSLYIPSNVKYLNTEVFNFWQRSLFERSISVINIDVPPEWDGSVKDFLYYCLFCFGSVAVFDIPETGLSFNPGNAYGYNFYYQPTNYLVTNPALNRSLDLVIGKDCEIIKICPDYRGIWDIITYYAEKLALLDSAINMSIQNSKMAWILGARNKSIAQTIKKIFDKVSRGDPLVIYDAKMQDDPQTKKEPWQFLERQSIKNSYITSDLLMDTQTILNDFDCQIGIPTVPYQKKERMVTSEAESRIIDSTSRSIVWKKTLDECFKLVNAHFGLDLSCELRFDPDKLKGEEASADE